MLATIVRGIVVRMRSREGVAMPRNFRFPVDFATQSFPRRRQLQTFLAPVKLAAFSRTCRATWLSPFFLPFSPVAGGSSSLYILFYVPRLRETKNMPQRTHTRAAERRDGRRCRPVSPIELRG